MARRLALAGLCLATLLPSWFRELAGRPSPPRACEPEGRGTVPRHWVGCATDPGPPRPLTGRERLLMGLTVDVNAATAEDLATVPGLTARLAVEVVADRGRRGTFASVDDLIRVRGIGPARLAQARRFLSTSW
jgi:competence protein ComEA